MGPTPENVLCSAARGLNRQGFYRQEDIAGVRHALTALLDSGQSVDHPSEVFGPWEALPGPAQTALRRLAETEISRTMAYHPRGFLWPRMIGSMYGMIRFLRGRGVLRGLSGCLEKWASRGWSGPQNLRERLYRQSALNGWARGKRLSAGALLAAMGRTPSWLLTDYLKGVNVDPRCRGFHTDRDRNVTFGYLLGIDLIPSPDGPWCIEANLNTAFNSDRREILSPEPAVDVLIAAAQAMQAGHVEWLDMDWAESPGWLIDDLHKAAGAAGMDAKIGEGYRVLRRTERSPGVPRLGKRLMSPRGLPPNTLVLRRNSFSVGSDFVVSNKDPFTRGVGSVLQTMGGGRVRVPRMAGDPSDVFVPLREGLPNLVYKYPAMGKGKGVYFLRVETPAEAVSIARDLDGRVGEGRGLFQPFVCSRILPGRRIYDIRTELFVTPHEARHVFSIRREATRSLPDRIEDGLLEGAGVFTSNLATGGRFAPLDPDEEGEIRDAAMAVGEALIQVLNTTFETGI